MTESSETLERDWMALTRAAARRVYDVARITPLERADALGAALGNTVLLKREDRQPVFSFKLRGAYNKIASLPAAARTGGVICSSAGNHAQGVAMAARMHDVHAVVVMPVTTPGIKVSAVRELGAEVILHGDNYDAAYAFAEATAQQRGLAFIHPFDDRQVIAGQATIALELDRQAPADLDAVFVPIGGGGLAAGIATVLKQLRPGVRVIGVEPQQSASMQAAFAAGHPVTLERVGTFADGVAVRRVGDLTFALCRDAIDDIVTVTTDQTCAAIRDIYEATRTMVEPAGALAVAGIKAWVRQQGVSGKVLIAINCGANLNFDRLRHIAERAAVGEFREALFAVRIDERPGSFRRFCTALGKRNITEFNYRYSPGEQAQIFVGIELREGSSERDTVAAAIAAAGYEACDLSDNELAKLHIRHLVGGRTTGIDNERLYRFEFPERPGALNDFLNAIGEHWNISLFHYRNHGSDFGRVVAGIDVDLDAVGGLHEHLDTLGFPYWDETDNAAYQLFLTD